MAVFQVDSDAVISATTAAQGTLGRLQGEANTLTGQLASLQSSWSGSAATAFQNVLGEWQRAQQQLEQVMASIHQALTVAANQYADIEAANQRLFMN